MGWGPNTEKLVNQFPQAMQVGVGPQHGETGKSVSTSYASWGGPQQRGSGTTNSFLFKLDFCPAPRAQKLYVPNLSLLTVDYRSENFQSLYHTISGSNTTQS
ncbi:hypothetical protein [Staphylococcus marylandisciuri]|uniref:hypothetical protein n=1 Tax=Staphylococcus marylandisciuri TaxID=2981529 RepID=UPI0021D33495|nr:hypothetical protein [Staphylococcus marylandisciuri]